MKVLGIIPSRYSSSRFPGKPLIDLKGKSMIQRVYENALKTQSISEIIVATDDERIFNHVIGFGGKVVMTKENHNSGTERCEEVAQNYDCDVVINIQGDEPLVNPIQLDQIISAFSDPKVEIATLGTKNISKEDLENPHRIKIILDAESNALYFSRSLIPNSHHFSGNALAFYPYMKHIGLYAFRKETLLAITKKQATKLEQIESLEQLRWLYHGYKIKVVETTIETPNIDTPEDVSKILALL